MNNAIQQPTGGNASPSEVLNGKTFTNDDGEKTGTMVNQGAVSGSVGVGGSYTVPAGYHNGSGKVSGPTLDGNADTGSVLAGKTFYSNSGTKQTGTMVDRTQSSITYTSSNQTPVQLADALFFDTNSDGVKRLCFRTNGIAGYYNNNTLVAMPAWRLGACEQANVISGCTFSSSAGIALSGTLTNHGAISATIAPGGSYTIPWGYHNGGGVVRAGKDTLSCTRIVTQNGAPAEATLTVNGNVSAVSGYGLAWGDGGPAFYIDIQYTNGGSWDRVYRARNSFHRSVNANPSTYWGFWCNTNASKYVYAVRVGMYDSDSDCCVNGFIFTS